MKTPMQELFEWLNKHGDNRLHGGKELTVHEIKNQVKQMLEKEKDLFCQFAKIYDDDLSRGIMRKVQDTFDETFRNNESAM